MLANRKISALLIQVFLSIVLVLSLAACKEGSNSNPQTPSAPAKETVAVSFFVEDENATKTTLKNTVKLSKDNFEEDFLKALTDEYEVVAKSFSIKNEKAVLDLDKTMTEKLNQGSTGSWMILSKLYKTIFSIENVNEIQVLVDGEEGVEADHFSFKGVMTQEKLSELEKGYAGEIQ